MLGCAMETDARTPPPSTDPDLIARACPTPEDVPFFNHCMTLAREQGMSWDEGLRYTIRQREERS